MYSAAVISSLLQSNEQNWMGGNGINSDVISAESTFLPLAACAAIVQSS
jgi:hypothetical protein